jgi:hypothetical protein
MELSLKEKFLVLAYHPEKGIRIAGSFMSYGLGGAILMELAEHGKIRIENKRIKLINSHSTGDTTLDNAIEILRNSNRSMRIKSLIGKIAHKPNKFKKPVLEKLIDSRVMKKERKRFLFIPYYRYPCMEKAYRKGLIESIRNLVLRKTEADNDIVMLTGLTGASQFINKFFKTKQERKIAKKRVKEIVEASQIDKAIDETIKAIQAAVIVSVTTTAAISASN